MVILGISILFIYLFYWNIALTVQVTSVSEVPTALQVSLTVRGWGIFSASSLSAHLLNGESKWEQCYAMKSSVLER